MTDAIVADFLAGFDDSRFPADFLQRYELMECLSQHELGETLLVKDRQTGEYYVAKCYADRSLLSQAGESDLLKKLQHAGLPAYTAEYQNGSMLCVVRAFAQGKSLDCLAQETRLTRAQSIAIAVQLCEILIYLHGQTPPIIHRDIKPQNIIAGEHGQITLIDFGISRAFDATAQADTLCLGTQYYAAPEQYGFSQTDCRSDIYSLGVLLCWLLTGAVDVRQARQAIPNRRLANIVTKCTAFAPEGRYKNVAQVRDALTGRTLRRRILAITCAALVVLAAVLFLFNSAVRQSRLPAGVTFQEPLIEAAVRLALDKDPSGAISEEDLLSVEELLVFGDRAAADEAAFQKYGESFMKNDGAVRRGGIRSLDDLAQLKNLRRVALVYQNITDLAPLAGLAALEWVDLRHNPLLADVTPLSQAPSLATLILFDTSVSDLTALRACPRLSMLDAGLTQITSLAALDGLHALQTLVIRKAPLTSLDGVETHPLLEIMYLSETQLLDLSPLLALPRLKEIEVSQNMRAAVDAIADKAQFEIIYQ